MTAHADPQPEPEYLDQLVFGSWIATLGVTLIAAGISVYVITTRSHGFLVLMSLGWTSLSAGLMLMAHRERLRPRDPIALRWTLPLFALAVVLFLLTVGWLTELFGPRIHDWQRGMLTAVESLLVVTALPLANVIRQRRRSS